MKDISNMSSNRKTTKVIIAILLYIIN